MSSILKIDVEKYMDTDEIKEIIRSKLEEKIAADAERIISNAAYHTVWKGVDGFIDRDTRKTIKSKIKAIIDSLSEFSIFKKPDAWDREPNAAYKIVQDAIREYTPLIKERVKQSILSRDYNKDIEEFGPLLAESFIELLSEKKEKQ